MDEMDRFEAEQVGISNESDPEEDPPPHDAINVSSTKNRKYLCFINLDKLTSTLSDSITIDKEIF